MRWMNGGGGMVTTDATHLTLLSWLSPAFPTGGFAFSAGLETAAHVSVVSNDDLQGWLAGQIENGPVWNDAVIAAAASRDCHDDAVLRELAALQRALCSTAERLAEIDAQGASFADASAHWLVSPVPRDLTFAVALGAAAGRSGIAAAELVPTLLHAFAVNQCQAAIRLSLTGQTGAAGILAALGPIIVHAAARAAASSLDDLGSAGILADIAGLRHETLETRLFRS
jgi:urease accessory protein